MVPNCEGSLLICGDLCPIESNEDMFSAGDVLALFGEELAGLMRASSGVVFNLEVPLTDRYDPIRKIGSDLIASPQSSKAFLGMNCKAVSLANNHILDQGVRGLSDTIACLENLGISHFGGGGGLEEARLSFVIEVEGRSVGFYSCAEHEFSIAGVDSPGANPYDPLRTMVDIATLSSEVDILVVLYHGMKEFCRYPSPEVVRRCRAMADAGASFIACQHSHCLGCREEYGGTEILYGQGDFHFTRGDRNELRRTGVVASLEIGSGIVSYLPIVNDGVTVSLASPQEAGAILGGFGERSNRILDAGFVEREWSSFCDSLGREYAYQILASVAPKWMMHLVKVLRKLGLYDPFDSLKRRPEAVLNMLQCEAHNEALRTILKKALDV